MDPVTSNIQANQHLKNENVLWVKKAQYDKKGCGNTSEIWNKTYYQVKRKKKQGSFFWGGGRKGESNLGGIDFYWYLLVKTSFWAPSHPSLPHILPSHNSTEKKCTTVPCESVTCQ